MNDTTRQSVAEALEKLAAEESWNPDVWQHCYDLVTANWENELLQYLHDDLIHYDGAFHELNLLGFRVKPNQNLLEGLPPRVSRHRSRFADKPVTRGSQEAVRSLMLQCVAGEKSRLRSNSRLKWLGVKIPLLMLIEVRLACGTAWGPFAPFLRQKGAEWNPLAMYWRRPVRSMAEDTSE
jgi:hypothetical protein